MFLKYLIVFILFSVLGFLFEYTVFKKPNPYGAFKVITGLKIPFLSMYGIGAVILVFLNKYLSEYSLLTKTLIGAIAINAMECLLGLLSYSLGYETWNYQDTIPMCKGHVSVGTAFFWTILIYIFFIILDKLNI